MRLSIRCRIDRPVANVRTPRERMDRRGAAGAGGRRSGSRAGRGAGGVPGGVQGRLLLALQRSPGTARGDARHLGEGRRRGRHRAASRASRPTRGPSCSSSSRWPRRSTSRVELALRDWARRDSEVAERVRRVDNRRMEYLRSLFGQFCADEETSRPAACWPSPCSSAATSSPREHGDKSRSEVLQLAIDRLLERVVGLRWPARHKRPVLVFDGDCAFCTSCARLLERIGPEAEIVAWQLTDLAELGMTKEQAADAVQWVQVDGTIRSGHEAIAAALNALAGSGRSSAARSYCRESPGSRRGSTGWSRTTGTGCPEARLRVRVDPARGRRVPDGQRGPLGLSGRWRGACATRAAGPVLDRRLRRHQRASSRAS